MGFFVKLVNGLLTGAFVLAMPGLFVTADAQTHRLEGRVHDLGGQPLQDARVITSINQANHTLADTTFTDSHGLWEVTRKTTGSKTGREVPGGYGLGRNFPNPFNPVTTVHFTTPEGGNYTFGVHDLLGRNVLAENIHLGSGRHEVAIQLKNTAAGTYIISVTGEKGRWAQTATLSGRAGLPGNNHIAVTSLSTKNNHVRKHSLQQADQDTGAQYRISIDKEGYTPWDTTFTSTNNHHHIHTKLKKKPTPKKTVTGNIHNNTTNETVPNTTINLTNGDFQYSTQANSDGSYSFEYPDTLDNITATLIKEGFYTKTTTINVQGQDKQKNFKIEKQPHITNFTIRPYNISKMEDMGENLNAIFELPFQQKTEHSLQANQDNNITLEDRSNNPEENYLIIEIQDPNQQYSDFRAIRKPNSHTIASNRIRENFQHDQHIPDPLIVNPYELNNKNLNLYVRNATYNHHELGKISTSSTKTLDQIYQHHGWINMALRPSTPDEEHYSEEFRNPRFFLLDHHFQTKELLNPEVLAAYKIVAQEIANIPKMSNNDTLLEFGNYEIISYPPEENELYQVAQQNNFYNAIFVWGHTGPSTNTFSVSQNYNNRIRGGSVSMDHRATTLSTMRHEFGEATFASADAQTQHSFNLMYLKNREINNLYKETIRMKLIIQPGKTVIRNN